MTSIYKATKLLPLMQEQPPRSVFPSLGELWSCCWYQVGHHRGWSMWERTFDSFSTRHPNLHRVLRFHQEWNILEAS